MKKLDLTGMRFHRLFVIEEAKEGGWICKCDCGKVKTLPRNKLRSGGVKSCGCLADESRRSRTAKMTEARRKYSPTQASAKRVWQGRYSDGNISFEKFMELSQLNCFYCGCAPSAKFNESAYDERRSKKAKEEGFFIYNGLDRVEQTKPHNVENVVTCCKRCNFCKGTLSQDDFLNQVRAIYLNMIKKIANK